jgi:nucleotide-binding universal stress UspA family protein
MNHLDALRREGSRTASFVLVAVDSQTDGLDAVAWAAAEATARQASLHILHVISWDPFGLGYVGPGDAGAYDAARRLLDKAADRARRVAPHLAIATRIHTGEPARTIALEGDEADLIVLGRDATCRPHRRWGRSVTLQVTARSQRPVAVVGFSGPRMHGRAAGRVVAVVPSDHDPAAAWAVLGAAFNAAHRRGVGVTVLADAPDIAAPGGTTIDDLVRQHLHVFFDVDLQRQPMTGPRGSLLTHASRSAALVVFAVPESRVARWRSRSAIGRLLETIPAPITFVHHRPGPLLVHRTSPFGGPR